MLHAEAAKRKIPHEDLREMFGVHSLSVVDVDALLRMLRGWKLRVPRKTALPRKGDQALQPGTPQMVSGEDLETLARAFAQRGWGLDTQRNFIRRQLRGREVVRTVADFQRVFSGVRAMNRRDQEALNGAGA